MRTLLNTSLSILFCLCLFPFSAQADLRPDSHAPIGVMGDHSHHAGEWMGAYRYRNMAMEDMRDGTDDLSLAEVLSQYMVAPTDMTMEMHMPGLMMGLNDQWTMAMMVPYIKKSMDAVTRMGREFTTETSGFGDVKVSGLLTIPMEHDAQVIFIFGLSLPTGSIDEKDNTPAGRAVLPYGMQLGSGTVNLLPGMTYTQHYENWSWGAQGKANIALDKNDRGYALGNSLMVTTWASRLVNEWLSLSIRCEGKSQRDIRGEDDDLNPMMTPGANTSLYSSDKILLMGGCNITAHHGRLEGHRFALEIGAPVYQKLDGPQMKTDLTTTLGWQYAW